MKTCSFLLSRIHRLLRPLKSSINSLQQQLKEQQQHQEQQQQQRKKRNHFYSEPKANKRAQQDNLEYNRRTTYKKKYKRTRNNNNNNNNTNPISSPIFPNHALKSQHHNHTNNHSNSSQQNQLIELETQIKIDKLILAYKNILDAVYPESHTCPSQDTDNQLTKLSTICARVIGQYIERAVDLETTNNDNPLDPAHSQHASSSNSSEQDVHQATSLFTELDWKTSVMDEWYDAIPLLYRRYALAQHALTMILRAFPIQDSSPKQAKRNAGLSNASSHASLSYAQKLILAIHSLHRSYNTPLIQSQAWLILPHLLSLPPARWFEIYDDYRHKYELEERFRHELMKRVEGRTFLEICSDRDMVAFVDLTMDQFGAWAMESWLSQRDALICSRSRWRMGREAREVGLESSDSEEAGGEEEAVSEYDKQSSTIVVKWIHSLVVACLPTSIHCKAARRELNAISRLLFDSLMAHTRCTSPDAKQECSPTDIYFLGLLSITIESHRLAIFGLPMFNTGSVERSGSEDAEWTSAHAPMRLQVLIGKLGPQMDGKMLSKAAKLFFRAHQSTRLLAVVPGLLWRDEEEEEEEEGRTVIPGLEQLLRSVVDGDYALERLAKTWVESLLQSDPSSWWLSPPATVHGSLGGSSEPEDSPSRAAHHVRRWLEHWLIVLDDAEKHRANLSDEHEEQEEEEQEEPAPPRSADALPVDNDEEKPVLACTCLHRPLPDPRHGALFLDEEEDDKPPIAEPAPPTASRRTPSLSSHVRVVVPLVRRSRKRARSSARLSLPSAASRRRKSRTPAAARVHSASVVPSPAATTAGSCSAGPSAPSCRLSTTPHLGGSRPAHVPHHHDDDDEEEEEEDDFDAMDLLAASARPRLSATPASTASSLRPSSLALRPRT